MFFSKKITKVEFLNFKNLNLSFRLESEKCKDDIFMTNRKLLKKVKTKKRGTTLYISQKNEHELSELFILLDVDVKEISFVNTKARIKNDLRGYQCNLLEKIKSIDSVVDMKYLFHWNIDINLKNSLFKINAIASNIFKLESYNSTFVCENGLIGFSKINSYDKSKTIFERDTFISQALDINVENSLLRVNITNLCSFNNTNEGTIKLYGNPDFEGSENIKNIFKLHYEGHYKSFLYKNNIHVSQEYINRIVKNNSFQYTKEIKDLHENAISELEEHEKITLSVLSKEHPDFKNKVIHSIDLKHLVNDLHIKIREENKLLNIISEVLEPKPELIITKTLNILSKEYPTDFISEDNRFKTIEDIKYIIKSKRALTDKQKNNLDILSNLFKIESDSMDLISFRF